MHKLDTLIISLADQRLYAFADKVLQASFAVSTALKGAGEQSGSGCTPRGWHQVRARIGDGLPLGAVLRGRRWTGEVWSAQLHAACPGRDWILTRILWLSGLEPGLNRSGAVDTFRRFIYIHGTPDCEPLGLPLSHGCIRMHSRDLLVLFEQVPVHARVLIREAAFCPERDSTDRILQCMVR